jgi:hypothetical protein
LQGYIDAWTDIGAAAQAAQARCGTTTGLVPETISRANAAVVRGRQALVELERVAGRITTAIGVQDATKTTEILSAVTDYQSYLSSAAVPDAEEIAEAKAERRENTQTNEELRAAGATPSLYTQMVRLQAQCVFRR